jgi:hypothetical protein
MPRLARAKCPAFAFPACTGPVCPAKASSPHRPRLASDFHVVHTKRRFVPTQNSGQLPGQRNEGSFETHVCMFRTECWEAAVFDSHGTHRNRRRIRRKCRRRQYVHLDCQKMPSTIRGLRVPNRYSVALPRISLARHTRLSAAGISVVSGQQVRSHNLAGGGRLGARSHHDHRFPGAPVGKRHERRSFLRPEAADSAGL